MGEIVRVLSFTRREENGVKFSDVKLNPGGGSNITGEYFADCGEDSPPLPSDYAVTTFIPRTGGEIPVAYVDTINDGKSIPGEKRIYGRDTDGNEVNEVWLKSDGSVTINNANGNIDIKADGEIEVLNAGGSMVLKPNGELTATATTSMVATAPQIDLIAAAVNLADNSGDELVTKSFLFSVFNTHIHGASTTPLPQATAGNHTAKTRGS